MNNQDNILIKKQDDEFSVYTIFFYMSCILGISVFVKYIYSSIVTPDDIGYWVGQYSFMSIQTLLDTTAIILVYVSIKNRLSWKFVIGTFFLMFYLNDLRYIVKIHHILSNLNMYWGIFRTGEGGTVTTLQYARITIITIFFIISLISTFFLKRTLLKTFVFIMAVAVYGSSVFLHYYVAFKPSKDASVSIGQQMSVVEYSSNPLALCEYTKYNCTIVKRGENYKNGILGKKNLSTSVNAKDMQVSVNELNKIINEGIQQMFASKDNKHYFHEGAFNASLFRAVVFNIRKLDDNTMLVIQDYQEMSRSTETYLFLLNFYNYLFVFFWATSLTYLYRIHAKMNKNGKIEELIN